MKLEFVNQYKYLGVIFFSTGLTFSYAHENMANRVKKKKKGMVGILKLLLTLGDQSPKLFFKLKNVQMDAYLF